MATLTDIYRDEAESFKVTAEILETLFFSGEGEERIKASIAKYNPFPKGSTKYFSYHARQLTKIINTQRGKR